MTCGHKHLIHPGRDHLRRRAVPGLVEGARQHGRLQVQLHCARAMCSYRPARCSASCSGEARRRIDLPARADRGEEAAALLQRLLDLLHVQRDLAEPDDVGTQSLGTAGGTGRGSQPGALEWGDRAAAQAPRLGEFAVLPAMLRIAGGSRLG